MITKDSKFNSYVDTLTSTNFVEFVDKQTTFLKVALKIFVVDVIKKDIVLSFVLIKYLKEKVTKSAIKVTILIDNTLIIIAEDTIY